jgi:hypothetical protein
MTALPPDYSSDTRSDDSPEEEAHSLALLAAVYTFPLHETMRLRAATSPRRNSGGEFAGDSAGSPLRWCNCYHHARQLLGAGKSRVVTPNNDTLYSTAWLNLTGEALVLSVPDTAGRYYVLGLLDFFTNPFAHIGRRTTGTDAGRFLVTGPQWRGTVPDGMSHVPSPTNWVWLIGRILIDGPAEIPTVTALQDAFTIHPLSVWRAGTAAQAAYQGERFDCRFDVDTTQVLSTPHFVRTVNRALAENPPPRREQELVDQFRRIGIGAGLETTVLDALPAPERRGVERAIENLPASLRDAAGKSMSGPGAKPGESGSWNRPEILGPSFGEDYLRRAIVAQKYIGALASVEAMYPMADTDSAGRPLAGSRRYRMHFAAGQLPPVDAFWSMTMYSAADYMLVQNSINRYAIGDRTAGLKYDADGGLTIWIAHAPPTPDRVCNWLPAPPDRFYLTFRAYQPRDEFLNGSYRLPAIESVD